MAESPLRVGMKTIIHAAMKAATQSMPEAPTALEIEKTTSSIEQAAFGTGRPSGVAHRLQYAATVRAASLALSRQAGPFPDNILGVMLVRGELTAAALLANHLAAEPPLDPRETMRRMFVKTLMAAHGLYARDRERTLATATAIEVSCYNAAVRVSKDSEDPPRRHWGSLDFVDIYSTRCGTVSALLDSRSSTCRAYGATLVPKLLEGAVPPESLGAMPTNELCPQATAAERAELAMRAVQKVDMKESALFLCPHCDQRRCTYQEVQRRSLDEAPDYLCRCLNCNRRFTGRS